jgi:hypothetical protein
VFNRQPGENTMKRHIRVFIAVLLLTGVVIMSHAIPAFAQEANLASIAPSCKAVFTEATGELVYRSYWGSPFHGQTTAEYLLSFPPLTIGFLKMVSPTQTFDYGVQNFTARPCRCASRSKMHKIVPCSACRVSWSSNDLEPSVAFWPHSS